MDYLNSIAEKIAKIIQTNAVVVVRMIKDKPSPYLIIILGEDLSNFLHYNIEKSLFETNVDFKHRNDIKSFLQSEKDKLFSIWQKLQNNETANGMYESSAGKN